MPQVNEAMQTLTAQWYNAMVTGLGLSDQEFQIYQGPSSFVMTSQSLWNMLNAVPPTAVNNYFSPGQVNNFSSDYNLILGALIGTSDTDFQSCMGDYFTKWQTYFEKNKPSPFTAKTVSDVFRQWAMVNAPGKTGCVTGLTKFFIDPINLAIVKFADADGKYAWDKTIDALQLALAGGASKSFTLNSKTGSSDLKHTWAKASGSVLFDLFSFGGSGSYDKITTKAISAGLIIQADFEKFTTFAAGPLAQPNSTDPVLKDFLPWYESAALAKAYSTKDNTVWNKQSPITWEKAFGGTGFLQRIAAALVAAEGISVTITSTATFSSSEQTEIREAAKSGFWPFFRASGESGSTNTVTFDAKGSFTLNNEIPLGNPQVLGILQEPMSRLFG
jgi:hypothetical protein